MTGKTRAYNLQRIEISKVSRAQYSQIIENNREKYAYTSDALSVAQLFDFVKQKDKTFNPKSSSAIVDKTGKPLIVYHGTDEQFSKFDTSRQRTSSKLNFGKGIYLTPNRSLAEMYSNTGNVMELYAVVKKPYNMVNKAFFFSRSHLVLFFMKK